MVFEHLKNMNVHINLNYRLQLSYSRDVKIIVKSQVVLEKESISRFTFKNVSFLLYLYA